MRFLCILLSLLTLWARAAPPNFILILSDDQDWAGTSVRMDPQEPLSAHPVIETPNLERLARSGMVFSRAYAPAPVCSPTRASVQTGKTPARLRWTKAAPPVTGARLIEGEQIRDLPLSEKTLAELLKDAGYATAHFGKWHLDGGGPAAHGFDHSDGNTGNRDVDAFGPPDPCNVFGMSDRAAAFMDAQRAAGKPFWVQYSSYALHAPSQALPETQSKYAEKLKGQETIAVQRAALAEDLDTGIGRLLDHVERLGLETNTYVLFMADNGAGGGARGHTRLLSAGKGGLQEGGIRVPFILRGPGVANGSVCRVPVAGWDLLPTFCTLAGIADHIPSGLDGGDLTPLFANGTGRVARANDALFFHFPHCQGDTPQSAIIRDSFKLIKWYEDDTTRLFNLEQDPGERRDLSGNEPDRARAMRRDLETYLNDVQASLPRPNPSADPSNPPRTKGRRRASG